MQQLLSHMTAALAQATQPQRLLLLRDGLLFSLLWQSCFRGFNDCPTLCYLLGVVHSLTSTPSCCCNQVPKYTSFQMPPKGGHCSLTFSSNLLCFTSWLQPASALYADAGQLIANFLTRPLIEGSQLFAEKPMSCTAIWARLTKYLRDYGKYTGESVHSTRRGKTIQHSKQAATWEEIGEAAMCSSQITQIAKYYTDVHRPTRFRLLPS